MNRNLNELQPLSLYIHVPFCVQKCNYCDFCSFPRANEDVKEQYVREIVRRLNDFSERCRGFRVETVYFGGGTPTLLRAEHFVRMLDAIASAYTLAQSPEISSECNPGTVNEESLRALCAAGVNRLSIGLQSANADELRLLGRIHTAEDFLRTVDDARRAGFSNLSADLMFGIPNQTAESFRKTLEFTLSASPEHVSAYGLKIEEGTPFGQNAARLALPDEDAEDGMYLDAVRMLDEAGLRRYEISNFAKDGYYSRHNYAYWTQQDYIGFGVSAHSYFLRERFASSRDLDAFLRGEDITEAREAITQEDALREYVMLRMRLETGVSASDFDARFGTGAFMRQYGKALQNYVAGGFVRETEDGYAFTTRGFRVSNYILSEIL